MSSAFRLTRALFVIDGQVQYNRQDDSGRARRPEGHPDLQRLGPAGRPHRPGRADLPGQRLRRLLVPARLQVRGEVEPRLHRGRGQDAHRHGDGAREGRRHDAARAASRRSSGTRRCSRSAPARRWPSARRRGRRARRRALAERPAEAASEVRRVAPRRSLARCVGAARWALRGAPRGLRRRGHVARRASSPPSGREIGRRAGGGQQAQAERQTAGAAPRERRAPLPHEGLRPRDRRPQRDPRGVPEHAELSRRALAPRRDVLRARTSTSRRGATTARSSTAAASRAFSRTSAGRSRASSTCRFA